MTAPRPDAADLLHAAAAGRRESASRLDPADPRQASVREEFLAEAATLEMAANLVHGDLGPLYNWLPSWRWTDEMLARIDEDFTAGHGRSPALNLGEPAGGPTEPLNREDPADMSTRTHDEPNQAEDGPDRATTITVQQLAQAIREGCARHADGDLAQCRGKFLRDPAGMLDFFGLMPTAYWRRGDGEGADLSEADREVARNAIAIIAVEHATDGLDLPEPDEDRPIPETAHQVVAELADVHGITDAYVMDPGPGTAHVPVPEGSVFLSDGHGSHPDPQRPTGHVVGRTYTDGREEQLLWIDPEARSLTGAIAMLAGLARYLRG